jgi:hypothetical protein
MLVEQQTPKYRSTWGGLSLQRLHGTTGASVNDGGREKQVETLSSYGREHDRLDRIVDIAATAVIDRPQHRPLDELVAAVPPEGVLGIAADADEFDEGIWVTVEQPLEGYHRRRDHYCRYLIAVLKCEGVHDSSFREKLQVWNILA